MPDPVIDEALRNFGANVRKHRLARGMTQGELAEKIDVEPLFVRVLEHARRSPSFATFVKLMNALEVDANALLEPTRLVQNPRGRPPKRRRRR